MDVKTRPVLTRLREGASAWVPLLVTAVFAVLVVVRPPLIEDSIENLLVDWRFKARNAIAPPAVPPGVLVVAVDEQSIARYGRWPWPRARIADLVETVAAGGPRAIGVDIFFSETESAAADKRLADVFDALRGRAVEALVFEVRRDAAFTGEVPDALIDHAFTRIARASSLRPLNASRVLVPPEPIASASTFGHVYYLPDRNGKLRWEYLYLRFGEEYFPSLALQTARIARGLPIDDVRLVGGQGVDFGGGTTIPADDHGRLLINYYGGAYSVPHLSAGDFLSGAISPERVRNAVVLIGATGVATYDQIVTPFAAGVPGVEKNATVVANILAADFLREAPLVLDLFVVLVAGFAVLFLCRGRRAVRALVSLTVLILLLVGVNLGCFLAGWHLALAYPLFLVLTQGSVTIALHYLTEERASREMRRMFSSYVTERVVNQLIAHPEMARLGGERRLVTILFSDIRGFTSISEKNSPETVVTLLNEYLGAMTEVIFHWEGTLDKFIGDAVMVYWGAPLPQQDHAERALRCALHMQQRLDELNRTWAAEGKITLEVGIGVNTGEVLVGNVGAEGKKMEYTVIGDHVNIASRVESLTKKYGSRILISEHTLDRIRPLLDNNAFGHVHVAVRCVGAVVVLGKEQAISLYDFIPLEQGEQTTIEECLTDVTHQTEKE